MTLYLALGSNLHDRQGLLNEALRQLDGAVGKLLCCSSFIETQPVGFSSPHPFLNAVAAFQTDKAAAEILQLTQDIEQRLGRLTKSVNGQYSDRTVDIDLLLLGDTVCHDERLRLPHPQLHQRTFVLAPLVSIAPDLLHPITQQSMSSLLADLLSHAPQAEQPESLTMLNANAIDDTLVGECQTLLNALSDQAPTLTTERLQEILSSPQTHIYIYRQYGIACAMFTLISCPALTGHKIWLEDVAVLPQKQGRGIGKTLMRHVKAEAHRLGGDKLMLTSRPAREAANKLYRSSGFQQRETNVYALTLHDRAD